jgi:hypothetical protein
MRNFDHAWLLARSRAVLAVLANARYLATRDAARDAGDNSASRSLAHQQAEYECCQRNADYGNLDYDEDEGEQFKARMADCGD